jgi:SAM-dependent methyltransferase
MHDTAYKYCELFYQTYVASRPGPKTVIELGSQDVNGSVRSIFNNDPTVAYTGVDYVPGNGVDLVLTDPYKLPFEDSSVDFIITSSVFEHVEMFWVMYLELIRILKPDGLLYINAPSNVFAYHRHPVDCWRFNPDAGEAMATWGRHSGYNCALVESFVGHKIDDGWHDFVSVTIKDSTFIGEYPQRIVQRTSSYHNGRLYGTDTIINHERFPF